MTAPRTDQPQPPDATDRPPPEPGDRPPPGRVAGRLERPPSERYAARRPANDAQATPGPAATRAATLQALAPAIAASLVTAAGLVLVGGVLAEKSGLLAIAGVGGAATGLLAANAAISPDGARPGVLARTTTVRLAVVLALLAVGGAAIGTWAYGRLEGGVLDPLTYLWTVFGPFIPAEAAIAAIAAAWGAGAGPIRGRS